MPPIDAYKRVGPHFPKDASTTPPSANDIAMEAAQREYNVWLLCRILSSELQEKHQVPGLGGFISVTGQPPKRKTTIDYYVPIDEPITQDSTVAELLRRSAEVTSQAAICHKYI